MTPNDVPGAPEAYGRPSRDVLDIWSKNFFLPQNRNFQKSKFCLISFSSVSRYFSILSSLSGRIRPHLALETQNFRNIDEKHMKNLHSKSEKCNFDQVVLLRKNTLFFHFFQVYATSQRVLTVKMKSLPRNRTKNVFKKFRNYCFIGFFPGAGGGSIFEFSHMPEMA